MTCLVTAEGLELLTSGIDILQPCVSFNYKNTYIWYQERVYEVEDEGDYHPTNKVLAFAKAQKWEDRIPIGVIYKEERPTFKEQLHAYQEATLT